MSNTLRRFIKKNDLITEYKCTVRLLDDDEVLECEFRSEDKGQVLLDFVCSSLNLLEKDYFGLRYVDDHKQRHWLDPRKSIRKQVKGLLPITFCFRIKFYPPEPHKLREELTRYQVFLQLRRDLLHGRLYCCQADATLLAAYILQSQVGDFDPDEHDKNYVADFKLLLKQTNTIETKIAEIHRTQLRGQVPATAEFNFLRKACLLDTYGVDPHPVKDHRRNQLYLGINHAGILTFQGSKKTHHFKWSEIRHINYERKMFIIRLVLNEKKLLIGFKCLTDSACSHLWRSAVEQKYFFNMESSRDIPSICKSGGLFTRGTKFRFSGRVEREIAEDNRGINRAPPRFTRSKTLSFKRKSTTLPAMSKKADLEEQLAYQNHSTPVTEGLFADIIDESTILPEPMADLNDEDFIIPPTFETKDDDNEKPVVEEEVARKENFVVNADLPASNHIDVASTPVENPRSEDPVSLRQEIQRSEDPVSLRQEIPIGTDLMTAPRRNSGSVKLVIHALLFAIVFVGCLTVVVLESDSELFREVRKIPEIIVFRRQYYEPTKDYVRDVIWP